MERRGGCCIVRYGGDADVAWKVDRIMLRFRPIAPKPVNGGSASTAAPDACGVAGKGKRRRGGSEGRKGRKIRRGAFREEEKKEANEVSSIVTLPLMPETPERKEEEKAPAAVTSPPSSDLAVPYVAMWGHGGVGDRTVLAPRPVRPAGSWVTVESVTDTWREGEVGGSDDEEVRRGLEGDTCPVFVSDACDRVTWTNGAYRRMVVGPEEGEEEEEEEVRVGLVTRGMVPGGACRTFTCTVRVQYACRKGKGSLAAPCDVWRLGDGGFAWRLDMKAALSLGR